MKDAKNIKPTTETKPEQTEAPKKVTLYHPVQFPNGREFEAGHAERIMKMNNNGGITRKKA